MRRLRPVVLVVTLSLACAAASEAQTTDVVPAGEPPVHGLFRTGGKATLIGSLATYGGHDETLIERTAPGGSDRRTSDGNYGGASAALGWSRPIGRGAMTASGNTDLRYYTRTGTVSDLTATTISAAFGVSVPTGQRSSLLFSQSGDVSSFYQFDPFSGFTLRNPEELLLPTADYRVDRSRTYISNTTASFESQVGRFSRLTLEHGTRYVRFPGELLSYRSHSQGFHFVRQIRPSLSFTTGYGFDFGTVGTSDAGRYHRIDLGVSYQSRLPFSRNTLFSMSSGGAVVALHEEDRDAVTQVPLLTVSATLRHQISRRWTAAVEYRRAPRLVELDRDPTYGDTAFVSLSGAPTRRISLRFSGGFAYDRLRAGRGGLASQTLFGSGRFSVRAVRTLYAYSEYALYGFEAGSAQSIVDPHRQIKRNAVRAGLNWRMPLFRPIAEP
jgi:hypothetical protein